MQVRVVVGSGLILAAMAAIAVAGYFANQEAYYTVDELLAGRNGAVAAAGLQPDLPTGRIQVRGVVDDESVARPSEGLEMRFTLTGKEGRVPVVYRGIVPDTFDLAESVTVGGTFDAAGTLDADQLFVQCPSKYEAEAPQSSGEGAGDG